MSQEITLCKLLAREVIPMDTKPNSTLFTVSAVCLVYFEKLYEDYTGTYWRERHAWGLRSCNSDYF